MNDARRYFDLYTFNNSTWHEIAEVLQYTYLFWHPMPGASPQKGRKTMKYLAILFVLVLCACTFTPVLPQAQWEAYATARAQPVPPIPTIEPQVAPPTATAELVPTVTSTPECLILGNIDAKGVKRYFLPGNPNYSQVKISKPGEQCFETEADAQAAGFAKAGN